MSTPPRRYYPYQAGAAAPAEFSVKADQSGANYTASDLIVAVKTGVKPTLSSTQMTFKHKMSRIVISVTNESGFDIRDIVIKGAVGTGVLDPATGDFTAKAGAEASDVTANTATAEKVYYALLVPQNGVQLKVTVPTADGKMRTQTLGTTDLKSGENRRMDCNVQPADIQVKFSGPIAGWVDGDDLLPDGDGEVETPTVEWGGVKYKIVTLKDGRTWMAENLRYQPAGTEIGDGVWYPEEGLSAVAEKGLLYDYKTVTGGATVRSGTPLRGICPEGWHVPALAELEALLAAGPAAGFFRCAGYWIVNGTSNRYGDADKGYLISCEATAERSGCLVYSTTTDPVTGEVPLGYGLSVRCVKDDAVR